MRKIHKLGGGSNSDDLDGIMEVVTMVQMGRESSGGDYCGITEVVGMVHTRRI